MTNDSYPYLVLGKKLDLSDGYTFLIGAAGLISNSLIRKDLPYSESDLVPVGMIAVAPSVIVVHPGVPANDLREFVAWAKSQGAKGVNWSTAGTGRRASRPCASARRSCSIAPASRAAKGR